MTDYEEIEIPAPWGTIHGKWYGSRREQPVLFLHGWQDNAGTFDPLIQLLPKTLSYLCIEFPGHGLSSPSGPGSYYYIFYDGLITTRRVVKYFNWDKVSIVGHSLGGGVGFMYAATYPEEIDKLVSLDIASPRVNQPKTLVEGFGKCIDRFLGYEKLSPDLQPCYEYEDMVDIAVEGYKGSVTRESAKILLKRGMRPAPGKEGKYLFNRDIRLKVAALGMPSMDIVIEWAKRIKCHYMNFRSKNGLVTETPEVYPTVMNEIRRNAQSFNFYDVEGTHHVHLNNPERIATTLSRFLLDNDPVTESCDIEASKAPVTNGYNPRLD